MRKWPSTQLGSGTPPLPSSSRHSSVGVNKYMLCGCWCRLTFFLPRGIVPPPTRPRSILRHAWPLHFAPLHFYLITLHYICHAPTYCCSSSSHGQKHSRQILSGGRSDFIDYSTNPSTEYTVEYSTRSLTDFSTEYKVDTATSFSSGSSGGSSSGLFSGMTSSEMYQVNA